MEETTPLLLGEKMEIPLSTSTLARQDVYGRRIPQAVAHRGYKIAYPENTMGAFKGAVEVGAHAIETDPHLSKDGVVVLSHDASLKRCYGRNEKIIDCDWSFLKTLRTIREPHEPMPRLKELLEYLASPGLEDIWLLLDIKLDNNADNIMRLIASTIAEVKPSRPWIERVALGCWTPKYLLPCTQYLPGFPIIHVGFSTVYAWQFLKVPNVSFNMHHKVMIGPIGNKFIQDCKKANRALYLWTVNDEGWMRWSIRKGVDGILTDDPQKFLEVCKDYGEDAPVYRLSMTEYPSIVCIKLLAIAFSFLFRCRYGFRIDVEKLRKERQSGRAAAKMA